MALMLPDIYINEKARQAAKYPWDAYFYAINILKSRWDGPAKELAEKTILKSGCKDNYLKFLREHDTSGYVSFMWELKRKGKIKAEEVKLASKELRFASKAKAFKHLANLTGQRIIIANHA